MKIRNLKRRIAVALAAAGFLVPASALAADLNVNLVANPGFEMVNTGDPGPYTSVRILEWTDADADNDDTFAFPYSSNYSGDPAPPDAGTYHFTGGFATTAGLATVTQSIDVSTGDTGTLIATGSARYDLRGFFSTYFTQPDSSTVRVRFLNSGMSELGSAFVGGRAFLDGLPILNDKTFWGQDAASGTLPVGTATVALDIVANASAGNHDGYVDLVDFTVGGLADDVALKLEVDTGTGRARLRNVTGDPVDINYYEVTSASGALNLSGWTSLQDQDFEGSGGTSGNGDGWEESGGAGANILSESYLLGSSVIGDQQAVNLGAPFVGGGAEDLVLRYGLSNGILLYGVVDFDADLGVSGDFNGDGSYDCLDINALSGEIAGGTNNSSFDLTGDGLVNLADRDAWLAEAGQANLPSHNPFLVGDANLDGNVDVSDFNLWNGAKFTNSSDYCAGDFNANGVVDVSDFNLWNGNKFTSALDGASVPEPHTVWLVGWGLAGLATAVRGRSRKNQ